MKLGVAIVPVVTPIRGSGVRNVFTRWLEAMVAYRKSSSNLNYTNQFNMRAENWSIAGQLTSWIFRCIEETAGWNWLKEPAVHFLFLYQSSFVPARSGSIISQSEAVCRHARNRPFWWIFASNIHRILSWGGSYLSPFFILWQLD